MRPRLESPPEVNGPTEDDGAGRLKRRAWLGLAASTVLAGRAWAEEGPSAEADEIREERAVLETATKAGLDRLSWSSSPHYACLGNVRVEDRKRALRWAEALRAGFLSEWPRLGFPARPDPKRLLILLTKDRPGFVAAARAFADHTPFEGVSGIYSIEFHLNICSHVIDSHSGRTDVEFMFRTACHEGMHQLCFHCGVFRRGADVPRWLAEGLATLAESWDAWGRPSLLERNGPAVAPALELARTRKGWVELPELLLDGTWKEENDEDYQARYGQSWLLVHYLVTEPAMGRRFRAYLATIAGRDDSSRQLQDAQAHFGDLGRLERSLIEHASLASDQSIQVSAIDPAKMRSSSLWAGWHAYVFVSMSSDRFAPKTCLRRRKHATQPGPDESGPSDRLVRGFGSGFRPRRRVRVFPTVGVARSAPASRTGTPSRWPIVV